jgi:hypothetical protein
LNERYLQGTGFGEVLTGSGGYVRCMQGVDHRS